MNKEQREQALAKYEQDMLDHPENYYTPEEAGERFDAIIRSLGGLPPANEREREVRRQIAKDIG